MGLTRDRQNRNAIVLAWISETPEITAGGILNRSPEKCPCSNVCAYTTIPVEQPEAAIGVAPESRAPGS
jgi:hypothetical protein